MEKHDQDHEQEQDVRDVIMSKSRIMCATRATGSEVLLRLPPAGE